jgi:hypothetical protein
VTISRPGVALPPAAAVTSSPRRGWPAWATPVLVLALLATVAAANSVAAAHDRRQVVRAADRVDATLVASTGRAHAGSFELTVLVANFGGDLRVRPARLVPALYDVVRAEQAVPVARGTTAEIGVRFRPSCDRPDATADPRVMLAVTPASGRARELGVLADARLLANLSRQACGFLTGAESARSVVVGPVTSSRYVVQFQLDVGNTSPRPFMVQDVIGVGLAVGVEGGLPAIVPAQDHVPLRLRVSLPACAGLPPEGEPGVPVFGALRLEVRDADGSTQSVPYVEFPHNGVHAALVALKSRICPSGSYRLHPPG